MIESDGWETVWPDLQASARELRLCRPWPSVPPMPARPWDHEFSISLYRGAVARAQAIPRALADRCVAWVLPRDLQPIVCVEATGRGQPS